jgi:hypothetical protein
VLRAGDNVAGLPKRKKNGGWREKIGVARKVRKVSR